MPIDRWRRIGATALAGALVLAACGGGSDVGDDAAPTTQAVASSTTSPAPTTATDSDAAGCAALGLTTMGGAAEGSATVGALAQRFAAMSAEEPESDRLVCAETMVAFRDDLVVQELQSDGHDDGALLAAIDGNRPVFRLNETEWTSFRDFRDEDGHNFLGPPTEWTELDGIRILRTTRGGLVFERPYSWGNGVINGAWDLWTAGGGPDGEMGLPMSRPTGTIGQGAHQDFAKGRLYLDGVTSSLEAEAAPASAYRWSPQAASDKGGEYKGNIVSVTGTAYLIDTNGIRRWLPSKRAWGCAKDQFEATEFRPDGWEIAPFPIGEPFDCPSS